jgi:hypothetical protein
MKVNVLPELSDDIGTPDKLVNGVNETFDDGQMWLAPFISDRRDEISYKTLENQIIIELDKPLILSMIRFWNYTKTPSRGVREVEIEVDETVIFRVKLKKKSFKSKGIFEKGSC